MKKLSIWARLHPGPARLFIVLSHLLLAGLAFFIGSSLTDVGLRPPVFLAWLFTLVFFLAVLCYPSSDRRRPGRDDLDRRCPGRDDLDHRQRDLDHGRPGRTSPDHRRPGRSTYRRRKTCDLLIATSGFCLLCWLAGNPESLLGGLAPTSATATATAPKASTRAASSTSEAYTQPAPTADTGFRSPTAASILDAFSHGNKKYLTRAEKRILVKEFRHQLKAYSRAEKQGAGTTVLKIFLILLAIVAAVGLLYLVASLACTISCNGADALALVVAIVGATGVVLLFIVALKAILRIGKHKKNPPVVPEGS